MEGEKGIHKHAKLREKKNRDLSQVKCIKNKAKYVLIKDNEINEKSKSYFDRIFKLEYEQDFQNLPEIDSNLSWYRRIR